MLIPVKNLDSGKILYFKSKTPYDAMTKLKYYLATIDSSAEKCIINKTESNRFLYMIFKGETYSVGMGRNG